MRSISVLMEENSKRLKIALFHLSLVELDQRGSEMSKNVPIIKADSEETYDEWFLRQAKIGLDMANSPDAKWLTHEEVVARAEARRREILERSENENAK
jgi:hypothetical protein